MSVCPACDASVREDQKFCSRCGSPLPAGAAPEKVRMPTAGHSGLESPALLCPSCNAGYPESTVYCEEDGTPLEKIERYVLSPLGREGKEAPAGPAERGEMTPGTARQVVEKKRSIPRTLVPVAILVLLALAGSLVYFSFSRGERASVEKEINAALRTRGLPLTAAVDSEERVSLKGTVGSGADRQAALAIARSHGNVKSVSVEQVTVAPSPIETERTLNKALDEAGLTGVQSEVDAGFGVFLSGVVRSERENTLAVKTVKAFPEVRSVRNGIKVERSGAVGGTLDGQKPFTETRQFTLAPLSPSSWTSLKYKSSVAFRIPGPGRLSVEATWEPKGTLAVMVNHVDSDSTHAQKDGASPLKLNYRITQGDFAKGAAWEATVANFTAAGPIKGSLKVTFQPAAAAFPPSTVHAGPGPIGIEREMNEALRKEGLGSVTAQVSSAGVATLKGSAASNEAKEKAIALARRFKTIKSVKDIIFVVGPQGNT